VFQSKITNLQSEIRAGGAMAKSSRMIGILALLFVVGCGKDSESPLPAVRVEEPPAAPALPSPPPVDPGAGVPKVEPVKVELPRAAWELDQTKHAIPAAPVKGSIGGVEAIPVALIEGT